MKYTHTWLRLFVAAGALLCFLHLYCILVASLLSTFGQARWLLRLFRLWFMAVQLFAHVTLSARAFTAVSHLQTQLLLHSVSDCYVMFLTPQQQYCRSALYSSEAVLDMFVQSIFLNEELNSDQQQLSYIIT